VTKNCLVQIGVNAKFWKLQSQARRNTEVEIVPDSTVFLKQPTLQTRLSEKTIDVDEAQ
jgi:hypothetical protein